MENKLLNNRILILETKIKELNIKLAEIYENRDIKTTVMPKEYYRLLKERQFLEAKIRPLWNEQSRLRREEYKENNYRKKFVNSFGEATTREITSGTYQRTQKKITQDVLHNMGIA